VQNDLKDVLQDSAVKDEATTNAAKEAEANEFREQRRRKRNSSGEQDKKNIRKPLCPPLK
jgi:hypothetical protein